MIPQAFSLGHVKAVVESAELALTSAPSYSWSSGQCVKAEMYGVPYGICDVPFM